MFRLFVGNFDFEHRLACGDGSLPRPVERVNAELAPAWAAVAEEGDAVWTPGGADPAAFDRLAELGLPRPTPVADPLTLPGWFELVFWGENDWAARMARKWGLRWNGCDGTIVRRVNSRRFAFGLQREFGVAPAGSCLVETPEGLAPAVAALADGPGWVLKGEFGGAGREVRFGRGPLSDADAAWAANRFRRGLAVVAEPRLDRIDEAGLQFRIGRGREIGLEGVTPLLTRPDGGYLGSRFDVGPEVLADWRDAIEVGYRVAEAVAAAGYFGPLGIDAMRYRAADGSVRVRPLQDLNARWTMGRLALGLRKAPAFAAATGGVFRPADLRAVPAGATI